jgi:hypothetical protein
VVGYLLLPGEAAADLPTAQPETFMLFMLTEIGWACRLFIAGNGVLIIRRVYQSQR